MPLETIAAVVAETLPFEPPPDARPRQGIAAEAGESFAFLAPASTIIAWLAKSHWPDMPEAIDLAIAAFTVSFGSFLLSRLRDLRWNFGKGK